MIAKSLVLASGSKFRQQILTATGVDFKVITSDVDESTIIENTGERMAVARADAKAKAVADQQSSSIVIGADQTLSFGGKIYNKAESRSEAKKRLLEFSGNNHYLHSAVIIYFSDENSKTKKIAEFCVNVPMKMKVLNDQQIENYLDSDEWKGCVGCYQAENKGSVLFESVGGNNTSVIGLPICELTLELEKIGISILENPNGPWTLTF